MPHSVIDIEVNDESFKRFHELFKEYQEQLGEQPDAWSKVGEAVEGVGAGFAGMTAALLAQRQLFKEEEDALKKQIKQQKQLLDQPALSCQINQVFHICPSGPLQAP